MNPAPELPRHIRDELEALGKLRDEDIDLSDIPRDYGLEQCRSRVPANQEVGYGSPRRGCAGLAQVERPKILRRASMQCSVK